MTAMQPLPKWLEPPLSDSSEGLGSGRLIGGKYCLGTLLGEGGMGAVYEAVHVGLGSRVAVKLLAEQSLGDPRSQARFRREARAAAAVRHANVVAVMDTGADEDGTLFLVMELLEGENLSSILKRQRRLRPAVAAAIASQILSGLTAAHEKGVVHRDLKPANVFLARQLDGTRRVKILDFGISKFNPAQADGELSSSETTGAPEGIGPPEITGDDALLGTPHFMAPEQLRRQPDLDQRVDIYAVGVLLYRMITGKMPFANYRPLELLPQMEGQSLVPPSRLCPDLPAALEEVIQKALQVDRDARFPDATSFRNALHFAVPKLAAQSGSAFSPTAPAAAPAATLLPAASDELPIDATTQSLAPGRPSRRRFWLATSGTLAMLAVAAVWWARRIDKPVGKLPPPTAVVATPAVRIGITRYLPTHLVARNYAPLIKHLSQHLQRNVQLVVLDDYLDLSQKLAEEDLAMAALSPYSYVRAKRLSPNIELLATPVTRQGDSFYEGYILARADSDIRSLTDLRGRVFCYVHPSSTSGYLYPRAMFRRAGLDPDSSFHATRFAGDHLASLRALYSKACDGAVVYANILRAAAKHAMPPQSFRVLASTEPIPYDAYCAPSTLDATLKQQLREALLSLTPGSAAAQRVFDANSDKIGFARVQDADYDNVRRIERYLDTPTAVAKGGSRSLPGGTSR